MPSVYPPGTAKKVPAGSDFIFEIHYTPIGKVRTDRSKVGLIFAKAPVTRQAYTVPIAQDEFLIPPHQDNVAVASSLTFAQDTRLLSFMPHMHLRGKDFRYTITRPGKPPETILSVPAYDFGWQSYYVLAEPLDAAQGDADRLPGPLSTIPTRTRTTPTRARPCGGATRPSRR